MTNDDEPTDEHLRAWQEHYRPEVERIKSEGGPSVYRASLFDLAVAPEVAPATLLAGLLADRTTARLLAAWRRSVIDLEAARAAAQAAGEDTAWFDVTVRAANDDKGATA